jgi:predicted HTH transcriptional regulator
MQRIFISSVQKELAAERRALKDYIHGDALLQRFFEVFLFEDLPAADRRADEVYLDQVDRCHIYIGLFGNEYGNEDAAGWSATEREFERATAQGKTRLIFVKGADDRQRHPKMLALTRKAGEQLIRRRFAGVPDLDAAVYASLVEHLERSGLLRMLPFDASAAGGAGIGDISEEKLRWFIAAARRERKYALTADATAEKALAHLNLLDSGRPTHAAILLFGREPQRFLPTSELKCLHFHGTEVRKPIPSYQVYKGTVFDLVDQALDFVLSKIVRTVGTREQGPQAPVQYELPRLAVAESIVNAVAHRDYASNASVQVMLFADRLEVWNPGELPPSLTPESLRKPHASIPRNPLIAEPLFLAHYNEKAGTGTLDMIALCRDAGLPEPEFRQDGGQFVMTLWRDWLTAKVLESSALNERQRMAITHVKTTGSITSGDYQKITGAPPRTATRDLDDLVIKELLRKVGNIGRGTRYVIGGKAANNRTNRPAPATRKSATNRPNRPADGPQPKPISKGPHKGQTGQKRKNPKGSQRAQRTQAKPTGQNRAKGNIRKPGKPAGSKRTNRKT